MGNLYRILLLALSHSSVDQVIPFQCPNTRVPMNAIPTFITRALHLATYMTGFAKTRTYAHNDKNVFPHQSI